MKFEDKMISKYPELFREKEDGTRYTQSGFSCPVGWEQLVEDTLGSIYLHVMYSSNSAPDNVRFYKVYKALWVPTYNFFYRLVNPEKVPLRDRFFKSKNVTVNWRHLKPGQAEIEEKWLGNRLRARLKKIDKWIKGGRNEFKGVPIAPVKIDQVKEKFGGLRIYTGGSDREVYGKISLAEYLSFKTCMWTGERGELYDNNGWIVTASKSKAEELGLKKR